MLSMGTLQMLNVKLSFPKYHKTKFTFHNLSKLINNGIYVIVYPSIFLGVILEYPHYCDCCALQLVCCLIPQDFGTFVAELQEACNDKTIASKTILKYRDCLFTARKRSLGQGKLLHLSVSHSVHGGGGPGRVPSLQNQVPPSPDQVHPPGTRYTPCWEKQATSGRYASCWNAFLLQNAFTRHLFYH